jgi:hypothetical protein
VQLKFARMPLLYGLVSALESTCTGEPKHDDRGTIKVGATLVSVACKKVARGDRVFRKALGARNAGSVISSTNEVGLTVDAPGLLEKVVCNSFPGF